MFLDYDQRPVDEVAQQVEHIVPVDPVVGRRSSFIARHFLGRLQRPATAEDRQPAEQPALRLRQQVVAPVDRRPQRLLAGQGRAAAAGQQTKAVVQPLGDLRG